MAKNPPQKNPPTKPPEPPPPLTDGLPADVRAQLEQVLKNTVGGKTNQQVVLSQVEAVVSRVTTYRGPLPPSDELARYDEISPGAADRILAMAERGMEHNHSMDERIVAIQEAESKEISATRRLGMYFGFVGFLLLVVGAVLTGIFVNPYLGGAFLGVGVLSVIPHFVNAHKKDKGEEPTS